MGIRWSTHSVLHAVCDRCGLGAPSGYGIGGSPFVWPDESPTLWRAEDGGRTLWVCERCREELRYEQGAEESGRRLLPRQA